MGFGAAQNDDSVGFGCEPIQVSYSAVFRQPKLLRLHRRSNRRSYRVYIDPEAMEDFSLPLRCGSAVAAHRRNNEWLTAAGFHGLRDSGQKLDETSDAAASGGDCNPVTGFDLVP